MIRHKFVSLRRRPRSSDEHLDKNLSLERLNDCRTALFKYRRATSPVDDCFVEVNECAKSDSDFIEEKKPKGHHSCSSMESCTGSREHIPLSRAHSAFARTHSPLSREHSTLSQEHSPLSRKHSTLSQQHSPLSREPSSLSREQDHSDSDDSTTHHEGDVVNNNNIFECKVKSRRSQERRSCKEDVNDRQLTRKKLSKRNSFTNAVRYFFISKAR